MSQGSTPPLTPTHGVNRLAFRLFMRHRGRMLFFASCIAIGVGFLFAIGNLLSSINGNIASKARSLMAADVSLGSWRPFDAKTEALIKKLKEEGYRTSKSVQFTSMAAPQKKGLLPFLSSIKAIEKSYPYYGQLIVEPANYRESFFEKGRLVCLLSAEAARQYHLKRGDKVRVGRLELTIHGLIKQEPDQVMSVAGIAPRLMIPRSLAKKTGLVQFGSRVRHAILIAAKKGTPNAARVAKALKKRLSEQLQDPYMRIQAYTESQPTIREVMQRIATFFVFVSLVALLLGAIGMAASVTTFLNEQLKTVGIFRCIGLNPSDVTAIYDRLCLAMGLLGGLLGIVLGTFLSIGSGHVLNNVLKVGLEVHIHWPYILECIGVSCALTLGLNYATVRSLTRLSPQEILSGRLSRIQLSRGSLTLTVSLFLLGFFLYALKTAYSLPIATFFTASIVGLILACALLIGLCLWALSWLSRKITGSQGLAFVVRHGLRQLVRQRVRTMTFLLSLTIGVTLISSLNLLQHSLVSEIRFGDGRKMPSLFLVDVQKDQVLSVQKILKPFPHDRAAFNPLIRARLSHINGKEITPQELKGNLSMEARSRARLLTREYNLTYKDRLNKSEKIIAGKFWGAGETGAQVSMEVRFANRLGLKLGDTVRFDIQGRGLDATLTSLRRINWMSMLPNFFVILPVHILKDAPQIMITSVALHNNRDLPKFQKQLNRAHPNISVIQLANILRNVQEILSYFIRILQGLAWACVFIGLLILAGTLSMGRNERRNKVALMRSLGSSQRTIVMIDCIEFLSIGVITGLIVTGLSWLLGASIASLMNIRFHMTPMQILEVLLAALLLPILVGLFSNRSTYRAGVMENLRESS